MFCGTSDGVVSLWDTGKPSLPTYDGVDVQMLVKLFPDYGDVYNIAWSGSNRWLLAGTAAGLVGWNIEDNKVKEEGKDYKYVCLILSYLFLFEFLLSLAVRGVTE